MSAALLMIALLGWGAGLDGDEPQGRRVTLSGDATLILPVDTDPQTPVDLVVHLHGAVPAVERALEASGWDANGVAVLVVNEPGLSSSYSKPFSDPSLFPSLLDEAEQALARERPGVNREGGRLIVSSFSAGFGGVRELLKQPEAMERIDALVLADSLYCGYEKDDTEAKRLDPDLMAGFRHFAIEAAEGRKAMLVSHCALVPEGYGSTAETADDLVSQVGGTFSNETEDWGDGWIQSRRFAKGGLVVIGFEGDQGEDHLRHLRRLGELWRQLPSR